MNERQDGGPILPTVVDGEHEFYPGLTIWDYYAAHALAGLCADPHEVGRGQSNVANDAANMADAMMAERERRVI